MSLVDQLLAGNRRALARIISQVEDDGPEAHALLAALYPHTGRAHVIGITGAPGTGKSTLVNALARVYRAQGQTVGIVAVDPTSPFSGGALLGDRVRMRDLAGDPGIFIRSMATRGSLGGLARTTADVILVLDAAGFDRILVETVGVGQAEVEIASAAHTTVVVEAPGMGDEVQAIKAGVLEIADIFVVNKADRAGADHVVMALQMMQGLAPSGAGHHRPSTALRQAQRPSTTSSRHGKPSSGHPKRSGAESKDSPGRGLLVERAMSQGNASQSSSNRKGPLFDRLRARAEYTLNAVESSTGSGSQPDGSWLPPITKTIATRGEGVEVVQEWVELHAIYLRETGHFTQRETARAEAELDHILREQLLASLLARLPDAMVPDLVEAIARRELDPYTAAQRILSHLGLS